ncbi:MAG: DUF368 domain-containing protein [Clostridiales bacterium]|nr:DUF368 domain-containing protein [Clostridiales bacterium]
MNLIFKMIQGALIGAGAVLPGVSGGVLAVLFGVYKPLMRLLAHPLKEWKNSLMQLWPILIGVVIGYIGIAKLLSTVLERYETQSLALFVGMTIGIMPSLFREAGEKGRSGRSWLSLALAFAAAMTVLIVFKFVIKMNIVPNFFWNMFGGFALVLSMIAPGMSSSVLLLPLNASYVNADGATVTSTLYEYITGAIGDLNFATLLPIGVGALLTVVLLTKAINWLLDNHYSVTFHGIIGIVIAATIFTIPLPVFPGWENSAFIMSVKTNETMSIFTANTGSCLVHLLFVVIGVIITLALDKFNQSVEKPEVE